jgi:nitrogen fixation protein NifX
LGLVPEPDAAPLGPTVRVAVATQDGKAMNAHFGSAQRFAVYDVTPSDRSFVEWVVFDARSDESGAHDPQVNPIAPKVAALRGCHLLFVLAIGGPAAASVIKAGIHPVKLSAPEPIEQVLAKVQAFMTGTPPPWLRKVLVAAAGTARSTDFLEQED